MTNAKHTPTPWDCVDSENYSAIFGKGFEKPIATCDSYSKGFGPSKEERKANATHIVKCVNMHDELVKAIRGLLDVYSRPDVTWCCNGHHCGCRGYSSRDIAEYFADETLKKAGAL